MKRYMLDTNIVSYLARDRAGNLRRHLVALKEDEEVCISAITEAEILYGLAKRPDAVRLERAVHALLDNLVVVPWDSRAARQYATLRTVNDRLGKHIGSFDLLIAAHALTEDATLVTNDAAFSNLESAPRITNWTAL